MRALRCFIAPALAWLASSGHNTSANSRAARCMEAAICLRESDGVHRIQLSASGRPLQHLARGLWQFELTGGVAEICEHPKLAWCRAAIKALGYSINPEELHKAIGYDQFLAAVMARGLLWIDPARLPEPVEESVDEAYAYYIRRWRPGKPRPEKWPANWLAAVRATREEWSE